MGMNRTVLAVAIGASVWASWLTSAASGSRVAGERAVQSGSTWKYAYITTRTSHAEICFVDERGCRIETVTAESEVPDRSNVVNLSAMAGRAQLKALARLGGQGWELVGAGRALGHAADADALYLRRRE